MRFALVTALTLLLACMRTSGSRQVLPGADAQRGVHLIAWYGCGSCHEIPQISGAVGTVAPPLHRLAHRAYITGSVPNTPANLVRWIQDPDRVDPRTIMPDMDIPPQDAADIAEFLYTLR